MRVGGHEYPRGQPGEPGGKRPESGGGGVMPPATSPEDAGAMPEDAGAMPPGTSPEGGGGGDMIG